MANIFTGIAAGRKRAWHAALAGCLAGCAAPPPPPPPPTLVNVTIAAAADVNPDEQGAPAPVQVRLYQLGTAANFNNAEFFQLYRNDTAALGADIAKREDFELSPGGKQTEQIKLDPPARSLGIFAGYRDYQNDTWRGSVDIAPNQTTNVTVSVGAHAVTVKSEVAPPPPRPAG